MKELLIEEGLKAPDFKLLGSDKKEHKLSDYINKKVILYFYPKDNTPGCSREAQDFKESIKDFTDNNTIIIGISRDSIKSHENLSKSMIFLFFFFLMKKKLYVTFMVY